jgi:hypothetical protein
VLPGDTAYVMSGSSFSVPRSAVAERSRGDGSEAVVYYTVYREALPSLGVDKSQNRRNDNASDGGMRRPLIGLERRESRLQGRELELQRLCAWLLHAQHVFFASKGFV